MHRHFSGEPAHRHSERRLGGVLPIAGVIFGLGLAFGVIVRPESGPAPARPFANSFERTAVLPPWRSANAFDPLLTYRAQVMRVIDGDTFAARVRVLPGVDVETRVRLRAIDAPELHARCAREYLKALAARRALIVLLGNGEITLSHVGADKYRGRIDATVATRDVADVSSALLKGGYARDYAGGRRESWCE